MPHWRVTGLCESQGVAFLVLEPITMVLGYTQIAKQSQRDGVPGLACRMLPCACAPSSMARMQLYMLEKHEAERYCMPP